MSDFQLLFAKSMAEMQLPRKRELWASNRKSLKAGDCPSVTQSEEKPASQMKLGDEDEEEDSLLKRKTISEILKLTSIYEKVHKGRLRSQTTSPVNAFTLCPSQHSAFLDHLEEKDVKLRKKTAAAAENIRVRSLGPATTSTKVTVAKPFQMFPNAGKDHNICYFRIQNTSQELLAYKIGTNRPKSYHINPTSAYVPAGSFIQVSATYSKAELTERDLVEDEIWIRRYCGGEKPARELMDFLHPESPMESTMTSIKLKAFVLHPCALLPAHQDKYTTFASVDVLENDPLVLKRRQRLKKLKCRNLGEKLFDRMQSTAEVSKEQLRKCRKRARVISILVSLISYLAVIGLLTFALYLVSEGRRERAPPPEEESWWNYLSLARGFQRFQGLAGIFVGGFASAVSSAYDICLFPFNLVMSYFIYKM